jgi:hypothetical protein
MLTILNGRKRHLTATITFYACLLQSVRIVNWKYKSMRDNREGYSFFVISILLPTAALYGQLVQVGPRNPHACEEVKVRPNLILPSESRVEGHIKDPSGAVMAHTRIELRRYVSEVKQKFLRQTQTDVDGRFSLGVVSSGRYRFIIFAPGFKQPVDLKCVNAKACDFKKRASNPESV